MIILAIESSCDETACALVENGRLVKSNIIQSQLERHEAFGGVVPEIAAREHLNAIDVVVERALQKAQLDIKNVDAIAVSQGPGLIGSLLVGVSYAKALAYALQRPLIPIDHVHAHIYGAFLGIASEKLFPCLALVVSGGHTNLYLMRQHLDFQLLSYSADDACGECFDKVAKLLGFAYPGGPIIEKHARTGNSETIKVPRVGMGGGKLGLFSYSGLKTFFANLIRSQPPQWVKENLGDICAAFQKEALGQIARVLAAAYQKYPDVQSVVVAGGVSANQYFRDLLAKKLPLTSYFPSLEYCSDNAAMIAAMAFHQRGQAPLPPNWDAYARYDFEKYLREKSS